MGVTGYRGLTKILVILILLSSFFAQAKNSVVPNRCVLMFQTEPPAKQVQRYLQSTLRSLESMRGQNGFLKDTILVQKNPKTLNGDTSPTNIAVDLLIQGELALTAFSTPSLRNIETVLNTLSRVEYHTETGLFFSRYTTHSQTQVKDYAVSSIDNLHLALALWTLQQNFTNTQVGLTAGRLLDRMDFSIYLNPSTGLIGGNLKYQNGRWIKEEYNFSNLGSEARILYSVGWALGLFRSHNTPFILESLKSTQAEIFNSPEGPILKLWDGAAFQLFFPKIFIAEENYSAHLKSFFTNAGNYMVQEGVRRNLNVPAAHSAVRASIQQRVDQPTYQDKAGNKDLVSSNNRDLLDPTLERHWDTVFTPYALFMAATANPTLLSNFKAIENVSSGGHSAYSSRMGWMDGVDLNSTQVGSTGQVIPAQISLNQGMIALSLLQLISKDNMSLSARTLFNNPQTKEKLYFFYDKFDKKLESGF